MKTSSLLDNLEYNDTKPAVKVLFETKTTKEIRIALKGGQVMKEHKTPYAIVVEMFEGNLDFGVKGEVFNLKRGDILSLDGGVPHDLKAISDCIVRLTLAKEDSVDRVLSVPTDFVYKKQ